MSTRSAAAVRRPHLSRRWQRIVAPLLLITLAVAMLAMHAMHSPSGRAQANTAAHTMSSSMLPRATETAAGTGQTAHALPVAVPDTPPAGMPCDMAACLGGTGAAGEMVLLCLALLPGLALVLWFLLGRPQAAAWWLRRLIGPAPPHAAGPVALAPPLLRLCVLRT